MNKLSEKKRELDDKIADWERTINEYKQAKQQMEFEKDEEIAKLKNSIDEMANRFAQMLK